MPDIYQPGTLVPDLKGKVNAAVTVVLHEPQEVDGLLALCELAGNPPEDPMHAVYRELSNSGLDGEAWLAWKRRSLPRTNFQPNDDDEMPIDRLAAAVKLAKQIWEKEEKDDLLLAVSVANPSAAAYPELEVETDVPVFTLRPGSLVASILKGSFKASPFAVCLFTHEGVTAHARAENLAEKIRKQALAKATTQLPVLRDMTPPALTKTRAKQPMLIVLVHGLLSTDAFHFDALIKSIEDNPFIFAGFPHNTLTHIEVNARELARSLSAAIQDADIPVGLVCHSRGGLVARLAAEYLYEDDRKKRREFWKNHLRICITFGTPHLGADLAEAPGEFIATFVVHAALSATRRITSLLDVLAYRSSHDCFEGIEDLKPGGEFLRSLEEREQGVSPNIRMLSFGGRAQPGNALGWGLVNRVFGTSEHDRVVRLTSSLPSFLPMELRKQTQCDHFGYFEASETEAFRHVQEELLKALAREPAVESDPIETSQRPTTSVPSSARLATDSPPRQHGIRRSAAVKPPEREPVPEGAKVRRGPVPPAGESQ